MNRVSKVIFTVLAALVCLTSIPAAMSAATVELTAPIKAAFDKTAASADGKTAAVMSSLYNALGIYQEEDRNWEGKIKALHYQNEQALIAVRKQIKEIDADKLKKLDTEVKQTRERYKPLFAGYTALNKQISASRKLKNKNLTAALSAQADVMKLAVQLARQDIDAKETALKTAKDSTARTIKTLRDALAAIDPLKVQITAQRSAASLPRKGLSPVWTNFKYAIKKTDAKRTFDSLETLVFLSRQIVQQQQKIHALETRISGIISKVKAQIPVS
ncbi:hypothetical protein SD71_02785 [Cohnella kolymensis]|uniref:Uncharacterized protein n=1 Tax=Cohnella kolymensis TaxID=1590652 RepID=A0ABR5A925_9BACL|nr:hypothetical protein [Cohnella kolymensis]KIL37559.1 hypothetical protein SD71_02785 [Cohnella kolymensis]